MCLAISFLLAIITLVLRLHGGCWLQVPWFSIALCRAQSWSWKCPQAQPAPIMPVGGSMDKLVGFPLALEATACPENKEAQHRSLGYLQPGAVCACVVCVLCFLHVQQMQWGGGGLTPTSRRKDLVPLLSSAFSQNAPNQLGAKGASWSSREATQKASTQKASTPPPPKKLQGD
uniref:Uncharacterized protein n=1 Tax=Eutreptiella gymnastica TaxID=73025 RepID=A0A7S4CFS4_9EUGL|mmetsp:Transcript_38144/g.62110  ORF Transcript_38144/g.62110 Transcript_38144/m.62110 type:complete len:174 (+) Transcript_38144:208-729(+)